MTADDYTREELDAKLHEYASLHDAMEGEINRLHAKIKEQEHESARNLGRMYKMNDQYIALRKENLELRTEIHRLRFGDEPMIVETGPRSP
jgi:hypothetical protein